jgi:hypothetical protein
MIIFSINIHGLGGKAKKLSLRRLCDDSKYIILIQETMGSFDSFLFDLDCLFPCWKFIGSDSADCQVV